MFPKPYSGISALCIRKTIVRISTLPVKDVVWCLVHNTHTICRSGAKDKLSQKHALPAVCFLCANFVRLQTELCKWLKAFLPYQLTEGPHAPTRACMQDSSSFSPCGDLKLEMTCCGGARRFWLIAAELVRTKVDRNKKGSAISSCIRCYQK